LNNRGDGWIFEPEVVESKGEGAEVLGIFEVKGDWFMIRKNGGEDKRGNVVGGKKEIVADEEVI
jgi:hypothetical protein